MKNNKILILITIVVTLLASCEKWLDVSPKADIKAEDLFSTENGFRDGLIGVYSLMTTNNSYGDYLSYSYLDVLAQYYDNVKTLSAYQHKFQKAVNYEYDDPIEVSRHNSIWSRAFKSIVNINAALTYIDKNISVFKTEDTYKIYKGEYLGLRALLHFDMLRLFAPSPGMSGGTGLNSLAIPYVDKYTNVPQEQLTVKQVLDKVVEDLLAAKELMRDVDYYGPKHNDFIPEEIPETLFNRKYRMNYYAVTALLARVYLYAGDKDLALIQAQEIIGLPDGANPSFFSLSEDAATPNDPLFRSEIIFGLNVEKLKDKIDSYFSASAENTSSLLSIKSEYKNNMYPSDGLSSEFRTSWFTETSSGASLRLVKYINMVEVPILKLSELYLIAAECESSTVNGLWYLNKLREHRGLNSLANADNFMEEIYHEYRREFIGEGQLFFFYKRNVYETIGANDNIELTPSTVYILPMPLNEIDFGNIKQ